MLWSFKNDLLGVTIMETVTDATKDFGTLFPTSCIYDNLVPAFLIGLFNAHSLQQMYACTVHKPVNCHDVLGA